MGRPANEIWAGVLVVTLVGVASADSAGAQPSRAPTCERMTAAHQDPTVWNGLTECGDLGGRGLALALKAAARWVDTTNLAALAAALTRIRDTAVLNAALAVAQDDSATAPVRSAALFTALAQYDSLVVRRPTGRGEAPGDSTMARCGLDLDRRRPAFRSAGRLSPATRWLIATTADRIAGRPGPAPVRLFARCVRLALGEETPGPPALITGIVRDTAGTPIVAADVLAMTSMTLGRTNQDGRFLLADQGAGPELVLVRSIGRRPERLPVVLAPGDTLILDITLGPAAVTLPELTVTAYGRTYTGKLADFGRRMLTTPAGRSAFLDPEELETWAKFDLADALRRAGLVVTGRDATCPGAPSSLRFPPLMAVFLDGTLVGKDTTFDVTTFPIQWIAAVEIYRRIVEAPVEFQVHDATCALVITTK